MLSKTYVRVGHAMTGGQMKMAHLGLIIAGQILVRPEQGRRTKIGQGGSIILTCAREIPPP